MVAAVQGLARQLLFHLEPLSKGVTEYLWEDYSLCLSLVVASIALELLFFGQHRIGCWIQYFARLVDSRGGLDQTRACLDEVVRHVVQTLALNVNQKISRVVV